MGWMHGLHLTADLRGCAPEQPLMTQPAKLRQLCLAAAQEAGLQAVGELFHRFEPSAPTGADAIAGITGVVLLAQSHLAVHTWPERGAVTIDVFICNFHGDHTRSAQIALDRLIDAFAPGDVLRQQLQRADAVIAAPGNP